MVGQIGILRQEIYFIILQSEVEAISASEPEIGKEQDTMTEPEQFSGIAKLQVCSYRSIHVLL